MELDESVGTELLFEDERCRVWLLRVPPGESTAWHVHRLRHAYLVTSPAPVYTEFLDGSREAQDDEVGAVSVRDCDAGHRLINPGTSVYENIVVEFKDLPCDAVCDA